MAIAFLLAGGFASAGELLLGSRSDSIRSWNESFLVGFGACAALLFPLSLLAPRSALLILLVLLGGSVFALLVRRWRAARRVKQGPIESRRIPLDRLSLACIAFIAAMIVSFAVLNLRMTFAWDGFQIWATKAMVLHHEGGLRPLLFQEADYTGRIVTYPNAVPLYEALLCVLRGGFDFGAVKPIFLVFYLSLIVGVHTAARTLLTARGALLAVVLLLSLPAVSLGHNLGGYADMPLAAAVAASCGACLRIRTDARAARAAPWLIGSLALFKKEGTLLAATFCLLLFTFVALSGAGALRRAVPRLAAYAAVIGGLCLAQALYGRWTANPDPTFGPIDWAHLSRAPQLVPIIARGCLRSLGNWRAWAILWPLFLLAGPLVWWRGSRTERLMVAGCTFVLLTYAGIFLFTTWDVALHVKNSYDRLAEQVAPVAVICLVLAWERLRPIADARASGTLPDQ